MCAQQIIAQDKDKLTQLVTMMLDEAKRLGASQAEVDAGLQVGFTVTSRMREVESVEFNRDKQVGLTVYFGQRQGTASTSDTDEQAIMDCVQKACTIARYTSEDPDAGLADKLQMAKSQPDLDLYHPWDISPQQAIDMAIQCESIGLDADHRIINSDGASISTAEGLRIYGNSHGFIGYKQGTHHDISCVLIAKHEGNMQRDYDFTVARSPEDLQFYQDIGKSAAKKAVSLLGARSVPTCRVPVIFEAKVARRLFGHFLSAIDGTSLYRQASFLQDHLHKPVFAQGITIEEQPHLKRGLSSAAFDGDGIATAARQIVTKGVLQGYVLDSYEARKLGMTSTANAGGTHNVIVQGGNKTLPELIKQIDKGLFITSLMGMGVNIVTGDYSQGATGFWIENGEIQFPVEEITVADNLKTMFLNMLEIGGDRDRRGGIQTGSVLIESMTVGGQ